MDLVWISGITVSTHRISDIENLYYVGAFK